MDLYFITLYFCWLIFGRGGLQNTYKLLIHESGVDNLFNLLNINCENTFFVNSNVCVELGVVNAMFNNISVISCLSDLVVEENEGPRENHRHVSSYLQTLSYNDVK